VGEDAMKRTVRINTRDLNTVPMTWERVTAVCRAVDRSFGATSCARRIWPGAAVSAERHRRRRHIRGTRRHFHARRHCRVRRHCRARRH